MRDAAGKTASLGVNGHDGPAGDQGAHVLAQSTCVPGSAFDDVGPDGVPFANATEHPIDWDFPTGAPGANINGTTPDAGEPPPPAWGINVFSFPGEQYKPPREDPPGASCYELLGLGLFEALPPPEMIEEL